jgi:hypothetical protein
MDLAQHTNLYMDSDLHTAQEEIIRPVPFHDLRWMIISQSQNTPNSQTLNPRKQPCLSAPCLHPHTFEGEKVQN